MRKEDELSIEQDVLDWVEHARHLGWDHAPDETVRESFRNWIIEQIGDEDEGTAFTDATMGRVFRQSLLTDRVCRQRT